MGHVGRGAGGAGGGCLEQGRGTAEARSPALTPAQSRPVTPSHAQSRPVTPKGRLRVSLPLVALLLTPVLAAFMRACPDIQLDLDVSDRSVDVIEEGFDAVLRTGHPSDSGLMSRNVGRFRLRIVAAPGYLQARGVPAAPADLAAHRCPRQRSPSTGKLRPWPLAMGATVLPEPMSATAVDPLIHLAVAGQGIACLPPFAVREEIADGRLLPLLETHIRETDPFNALWSARRQVTAKLRAFIDFTAAHLRPD